MKRKGKGKVMVKRRRRSEERLRSSIKTDHLRNYRVLVSSPPCNPTTQISDSRWKEAAYSHKGTAPQQMSSGRSICSTRPAVSAGKVEQQA